MKYEITKEFTFDSAHFLAKSCAEKSETVYGKCASMHGHTYHLFVTVGSETLIDGMVMNFVNLKTAVSQLLDDVDHKVLNNVVWLKSLKDEVTCENLLEVFWGRLKKLLPKTVKLVELRLYETPTSYGEYRG